MKKAINYKLMTEIIIDKSLPRKYACYDENVRNILKLVRYSNGRKEKLLLQYFADFKFFNQNVLYVNSSALGGFNELYSQGWMHPPKPYRPELTMLKKNYTII